MYSDCTNAILSSTKQRCGFVRARATSARGQGKPGQIGRSVGVARQRACNSSAGEMRFLHACFLEGFCPRLFFHRGFHSPRLEPCNLKIHSFVLVKVVGSWYYQTWPYSFAHFSLCETSLCDPATQQRPFLVSKNHVLRTRATFLLRYGRWIHIHIYLVHASFPNIAVTITIITVIRSPCSP